MEGAKKLKPTGWALMGGDRGKWHWFGADGRSLCGKWANLTWNILEQDVHPDEQCAACRRKFNRTFITGSLEPR
jgi:hypothetical protein